MNILLHRILNNQRVSLARFNDGEVGAITGNLTKTSRGRQEVTPALVADLNKVLDYRNDGFYIGIPCPICYDGYYQVIMDRLDDYPNKILAVSTTNNHYRTFKNELLTLLSKKNVALVTDQEIKIPQLTNLTTYLCPSRDAHASVEKTFKSLGHHDYYILTGGASSRVLAWLLHREGKNALDLGSIFDPEKGRPLKAHNWYHRYKNEQNYCPICNY